MNAESQKARDLYNKIAPFYNSIMIVAESLLFGHRRRGLVKDLKGNIVEFAVGSGLNLPFYPEDATIIGLDISPRMIDAARERAAKHGLRNLSLVKADVLNSGLASDTYDVVVCTYALCGISPPESLVIEAKRILRPGGHLLMIEHGKSNFRVLNLFMAYLERYSTRIGEHLTRDAGSEVKKHFANVEISRTRWGIVQTIRATKALSKINNK